MLDSIINKNKINQTRHFDKISGSYGLKIYKDAYSYYFSLTADALFRELNKHFSILNDKIGLDVGCGVGDISKYFQKYIKHMFGFDISYGMAFQAYNQGIQSFASSSDAIPVKESSLDFVFSVHVIHHLIDKNLIKNTFMEVSRILKKEGIFIVVDLNKLNPLTQYIQYLMVKRGVDTGCERLQFCSTLINLAEESKLVLADSHGITFIPHIFPKFKSYNTFFEKTPFEVFGRDYILVFKKE